MMAIGIGISIAFQQQPATGGAPSLDVLVDDSGNVIEDDTNDPLTPAE